MTQRRWKRQLMKNHVISNKDSGKYLIVALISLCVLTMHVAGFPMVRYSSTLPSDSEPYLNAAGLPIVMFPLKPAPETGPYQDEEFLVLANLTINNLSDKNLPNGTDLIDLQTTQQKLSRMSISPELYPLATKINDYLYYSTKAGSTYYNAWGMYSKPYSPVYKDESVINEARRYQDASRIVWNEIRDLYPGVVPYTFESPTKPFSTNEDPYFQWPPYSAFTSTSTEGLW